jgi:hypothetical protein
MKPKLPDPTEPVPAVTQIVILPFLAALQGFIQADDLEPDFRVTVHRTMVRGDQQFLQQVTPYIGYQSGGGGRTFHTNTGVMGASYHSGKVFRTKHYSEESQLQADIAADQKDNDTTGVVPPSYLSVPFIGVNGRPVLVLYADSKRFNRFADDDLVRGIVSMCRGFAHFVTELQQAPIGAIRNFPLVEAGDAVGEPTVFKRIQEELDWINAPSIAPISSFNFESSAA